MRLQRVADGSYVFAHPMLGPTAHFRIERGWADQPGTDRRRQWWMLSRVDRHDGEYRAEILSDHGRLADARAELARLLRALAPSKAER